jgi:hypothetical protein
MSVYKLTLRQIPFSEAMKSLKAEEICEICIMVLKPLLTYFENYLYNPYNQLNKFSKQFKLQMINKLRLIQLISTVKILKRYSNASIVDIIGFQQIQCKETGGVKLKILFHLEQLSETEIDKISLKTIVSLLSIIIDNGLNGVKTKAKVSTRIFELVEELETLFETTKRVLREYFPSDVAERNSVTHKLDYLQMQVTMSDCLIAKQLIMTYRGPVGPLISALNNLDHLQL